MLAPDVTLVNLTGRTMHVVMRLDADRRFAVTLRKDPVPGSRCITAGERLALSSANDQMLAALDRGKRLRFAVVNRTGQALDFAETRSVETNAPVLVFSASAPNNGAER